MHAWRAREVRIYVPGDTPQWCLDNGEDDLIPCGAGASGKERAGKLAETLNLGHALKARQIRNPKENVVLQAANNIYARCQKIDMAIQIARWPDTVSDNIRSELGELTKEIIEMQKAMFN